MQKIIDTEVQPERHRKRSYTAFDSFAEYMDYVEKEPSKQCGELSSRKPKADWGGKCWYGGTSSIGQAMKLAREGWQEGREMIERLTARLESVTGNMVQPPVIQWSVSGDFADAGLYATGVPECMACFAEDDARLGAGKIVKVLMNMSVSAGVDTDVIMRRGAAVCALVDALETAGRSCEIILCAGTAGGDWEVMTQVPVKHAGEPLEIDRMAFLLAHPASFRRLVFSAWEHEPKHIRWDIGITAGGGYGHCLQAQPDADDLNVINVPTLDLRTHKDDAALIGWIEEELKRQGCTVEV